MEKVIYRGSTFFIIANPIFLAGCWTRIDHRQLAGPRMHEPLVIFLSSQQIINEKAANR